MQSVSNSSPSQAPLGKLFALLTKWYVGAVTAKLTHLPIERHFYVLMVIDGMKGAVTQKELAEMVFTDKASMVRILDYLTEHGMIERITDPNDRRAYRLRTTAKGKKAVPVIQNAFAEVNTAAFEGLSVDEIAKAHAMLEKMACNLSRLPSEQVFLQFNRKGQSPKA